VPNTVVFKNRSGSFIIVSIKHCENKKKNIGDFKGGTTDGGDEIFTKRRFGGKK